MEYLPESHFLSQPDAMIIPKLNALTCSTSCRQFSVLLGPALGALIFLFGCAQVEEAAQKLEETVECEASADNFEEDWPRVVADQQEREVHKALAYSKATESNCFAYGYSNGYDSRQEAIERAMSECRSYKAKFEKKRNASYEECTLHSVDGERQ